MSAIDRRIMKSAESIRFHQRERLRNTGGGQLVSAGVATFKAGFVTYGAGVELDAHESIKNQIPLNQVMFLRRHIPPKKQSTGSKKKTEGRHMHGQTHGGGPKPNFKPQNNKRKKADEHRNKGKVIN